jgi:hypothetical protein
LFSQDAVRFYYGERSIDKDLLVAARLLINGIPVAQARRRAAPGGIEPARVAPGAAADNPPDGIARDRWDVELEAANGMTLVECGAIRERVSQELARAVFDAVKREVDR